MACATRGCGASAVALTRTPGWAFAPKSCRPARRRLRVRMEAGNGADAASKATGFAAWAQRVYVNVTGFPFPLTPLLERKTLRYEVVPGRMWTFEQEQGLGFSSVTTSTRMTVIRLQTGGLWVHAPIAPTRECVALLKELDAPVEHIVLPTFAYEHKIFVAPFARKFPSAKVWTAPAQWSWPINLPPQLLGIFPAGTLVDGDADVPWAEEIEQKVLLCPEVGIGPYTEVAFFHRPSQTLLVTDAVIYVPRNAPPIVPLRVLLASAENGIAVQILSAGQEVPKRKVENTPAMRLLGWQRMVLQVLFFGPSNLLDPSQSFSQVSERLIVSPVVRTLVFNKVPVQVKRWVEAICSEWNFTQVIPAHFSAPIKAGPKDFRSAFYFLDELVPSPPPSLLSRLQRLFSKSVTNLPEADMKTLDSLDNLLVNVGAVKKTGVA